ncbi:MAG: protein arginine kinase [Kiritimatiellia bacterium]
MNFDQLLKRPTAWQTRDHSTGIVVSSRVRLARNLPDLPFPGWADDAARMKAWNRIQPVVTSLPSLPDCFSCGLGDLTKLDRQMLFERNVISREHAERNEGGGIVVAPDTGVSIMVNEEDHLRIQAFDAGLRLQECLAKADRADTEIESRLDYAFSPKLGYLTACPSNVGTGMRASVMLHVPGLVLMEEISAVVRGLGKIDLAVRGLGGEGSEAIGNLFQVSNQITLGGVESEVVDSFQKIILDLVQNETDARLRLRESCETLLRNHVGRAFGILTNAWLLSTKETLDLLSAVRLGIDLGMITGADPAVVDELFLLTRPGHLQKLMGRRMKAGERDEFRASLVRGKLAGTKLNA